MKRRTLLQSLAAALFVRPSASLGVRAQAPATLTEAQVTTLRAVAEVVLPTAAVGEARGPPWRGGAGVVPPPGAGAGGRPAAAGGFVTGVRDYREGADRGHSSGASVVSPVPGPSPASRYPAQFAALDQAAS